MLDLLMTREFLLILSLINLTVGFGFMIKLWSEPWDAAEPSSLTWAITKIKRPLKKFYNWTAKGA
jgi:hypothetical protein